MAYDSDISGHPPVNVAAEPHRDLLFFDPEGIHDSGPGLAEIKLVVIIRDAVNVVQQIAAVANLKFWSEPGRAREELHILIVEEQLKMLRIEAELSKTPANLACHRVIGGGSGPSLVACLVDELKEAAVFEKQGRLREL